MGFSLGGLVKGAIGLGELTVETISDGFKEVEKATGWVVNKAEEGIYKITPDFLEAGPVSLFTSYLTDTFLGPFEQVRAAWTVATTLFDPDGHQKWYDYALTPLLGAADLAGGVRLFEEAYGAFNADLRPLNAAERNMAEQVFGDSIDLDLVRVNPTDFIRDIGIGTGAWTSFHTINVKATDYSLSLISHELTHVWQYEENGPQYLVRALRAQPDYDYGGPEGLMGLVDARKGLLDLNFEQMGDVVEHYAKVRLGLDDAAGLTAVEVSSKTGDRAAHPDGQHRFYVHDYDMQLYAGLVESVSSRPLEGLSPASVTGTDPGTDPDPSKARRGLSGVDVIYGNRLANDQNGLGGDDRLHGLAGNDTLSGGGGNDHLDGGTDDDFLLGGYGDDILNGWDGNDTASWERDFFGAVQADLVAGTARRGVAEIDTLRSIENLRGGGQGDTFTGDGAANLLEGLGGDDTLEGGGGKDTLDGGGGQDTASFARATEGVRADLAAGTAALGAGGDEILRWIEDALGSGLGDALSGTDGNNVLNGGAGDDVLAGRAGADILAGGPGRDIFVYGSLADSGVGPAASDRIADFVQGQDVVSFLPTDLLMIWIGAAPFTPVRAGPVDYDDIQIHFRQDGAYTYLELNSDLDLDPELSIELAGTYALTRDDVLFPEVISPR